MVILWVLGKNKAVLLTQFATYLHNLTLGRIMTGVRLNKLDVAKFVVRVVVDAAGASAASPGGHRCGASRRAARSAPMPPPLGPEVAANDKGGDGKQCGGKPTDGAPKNKARHGLAFGGVAGVGRMLATQPALVDRLVV